MSAAKKAGAAWLAAAAALILLGGCARDMDDLQQYIGEIKARKGGRIEPLPEIKPYETFAYAAMDLRSPFVPDTPLAAKDSGAGSGIRPDANRNREFLEQFPLDTLRMVGTLQASGQFYGLVQDNEGLVHRVQPGNYLGQNDGKIVNISESTIELTEIVSDGLGGYFERPAAVTLSE